MNLMPHRNALTLFTLSVLALVISGCSGFPETRDELITTGNKSPAYCLADGRDVVEPRVQAYLMKCFRATYVSAGNGAGFVSNQKIEKVQADGKTQLTVYTPSGTGAGYFLNVDLADGQGTCKTTMNVTAMNFMWERNFSKLQEHATGEDTGCPL